MTTRAYGETDRDWGLFIDGRWEAVDRPWLEVYDKYRQRRLGRMAVATAEDVERAVQAAARAMREQPLSAHRRYQILLRAAEILRQEAEAVTRLIVREGGKPYKDASAEVARALQTLTLSAEEAKRIHGETLPLDAMPGMEQRLGLTLRVPVGVIAAITPFNFPLNLVLHKVGPAIAAGNAVVLKPASTTPLTAAWLCDALTEAGLPPGYLNLVVGPGGQVGDALVRHPGVRMVTFTGSRAVGRRIKEMSGLKKVTLELGNSSPNLVHADADLDLAARLLAAKGFAQAGQSCISVQRILVHQAVADRFAEKLVAATRALKVGDPEDPDTDVGPLITEEEAKRVEAWLAEAVAQGARLLTGGRRQGPVVEPTVVADARPEMRVCREEVFGPVVTLTPYRDLDEAIALANDTVYGLQAGVFTRDLAVAWKAAQALEFGGVIINDASSFRADLMPYGGVKESGIGREGPRYAVEEMTELRDVIFYLPFSV